MASRHESTGEADRVQASEATMLELLESPDKFVLTERGRGTLGKSMNRHRHFAPTPDSLAFG